MSVYNGHDSLPMQNVRLYLEVKDSEGNVAGSQLFQVNPENLDKLTGIDGTGALAAQQTGTATILFIPSKYAAPSVSQVYTFGGTLSYLDPFTGTTVTRNLYPVTLTVKPSPDLTLDYFMQRDVLGDDPLTKYVVEPIVPAEFSLLINNVGAGDATNVHFTTSQPQITKNEKGLLNKFELIGSSMNGAEKTVNFSDNDFGTISAGNTSYAQWWFTSDLLGHFVDYDTKVTHLTSFGNPDLSLVSNVAIHELIRSLNIPYLDGTTLTGFLANDITDGDDLPDMLYISDGTISEVSVTTNAVFTKVDNTKYKISVTPNKKGWNYGVFNDPGNGGLKLTSVVRQSDKATISLRNFWQTDRTLRDGKDPLYENKIHFADNIQNASETYLLTFDTIRSNILSVKSFTGVPDSISKTPVKKISIIFNKAIDKSTFTSDAISLTCQGKRVDISKIVISQVWDTEYSLDLSQVSELIGNGYFVISIQTKNIRDYEGYLGESGTQKGWTQYLNGNVTLTVQVFPTGSGSVTPNSGGFNYGNQVDFVATPAKGYRFSNWAINGEVVSTEPTFNYPVTEPKTITANFEAKYYNVILNYDENQGSVIGSSSGTYSFNSLMNFEIVPNVGYIFIGWKVNDVLIETKKSFTLIVTDNLIIEPVFLKYDQSVNVKISQKWDDVLVCNNIENLFSSYQWYKNDVEITSQTKQYYQEVGGLNGSYYVKVVATDGRIGVSNTIIVNQSAKSIKAYPNPTADNQGFYVEIQASESDIKQAELTVSTLSGQIVLQNNNVKQQMQLKGLPKGCYIIHVRLTNGELLNEKLIVK